MVFYRITTEKKLFNFSSFLNNVAKNWLLKE